MIHRTTFALLALLCLSVSALAHRPAAIPLAPITSGVPALGPAGYELQEEDGTPIGDPGRYVVWAVPTAIRGVYSLTTVYMPEEGPYVILYNESGFAVKTATGYDTSTSTTTGTLELQNDGRWKETLSSGNTSYWG
ncbi:MAG: hypothetical protein ACE37K_19205 [Planctomycetota bacterium]